MGKGLERQRQSSVPGLTVGVGVTPRSLSAACSLGTVTPDLRAGPGPGRDWGGTYLDLTEVQLCV